MPSWKISGGFKLTHYQDLFMVGRFISQGGRQRNLPSVRFGNISMMPLEKVKNSFGLMVRIFLVECRSIGGYSGSPVFVYINPDWPRPKGAVSYSDILGPWLLGVDYGHVISHEQVQCKSHGEWKDSQQLRSVSNTAMARVVPAWDLAKLLQTNERLIRQRECEDKLAEEPMAKEVLDTKRRTSIRRRR